MAVKAWVLPVGVTGRSDVTRLQGELEAVDNFLRQAAIRAGNANQLPKTSQLFSELVASNKLNMLLESDRTELGKFLSALREKAPLLHISFNTDPSALFTQRLLTWLRQNIHQYVLLQIGLHPSIGAGCVVRTDNKYFDFSLRQRFTDQRELLIAQLRGQERAAEATNTKHVVAQEVPA